MYEVLFFSALVLSLIFCGMPGAVNTQALRVGVTGGFHRAFRVETGSIVGDMTWAVIALVGLAFVWDNDVARYVLGALGGTILIYLAYHGFQDARRKDMPEPQVLTGRSDFMTGVVISFVNPFQIPFWIGIGSSAIAVIILEPQLMDFVIFYLGYFTGAVIWGIGYSALIGYGRRYVTPKLFRGISFICALVMMYFAVSLLWNTFLV
ncbi:MAG TPA: LysE family transporter [Methanomassiliicoccales archaeon]|nr:LysE family transporter [Methanomassiliicoccales archaeon]